MKLELKHLAPYLPYEIDVLGYNNVVYKATLWNAKDCVEKQYSPILRPMSDINKMIQHPTEKAQKANLYLCYDLEKDEDGDYCDVYYADQCESPSVLVPIASFNWWLFEWHFDVFGLIPAGIAIDINTL